MSPAQLRALPEPTLARWQPLRLGLVELYHYDSEEFWFRDGHLLMRGNNGTGKSKVLSLTLPFLLDANLSSARVEPDGDRSKRMDWNLLMGGRHERRTGYAWIEFGRRDDAGRALVVTLGCGLRAVAGRAHVEPWYFMTEQRVGEDLWLMTPERVALSREKLVEAIGARGQVFATGEAYRRTVDERLFQLGPERYAALIDTLIQLRQPQLSKQPNEQRLSDALTEALPPVERSVIEDVAEAMNQLEDYRRELEEIEAMRKSIAAFEQRYRRYAQVASRRRARTLRQAQTDFDGASRELNGAEERLAEAVANVTRWQQQQQLCDERIAATQARLDVLRAHPVMRDAARIDQVRKQLEQHRRELDAAERRWRMAQAVLDDEQRRTAQRRRDFEQTRQASIAQASACAELAQRTGVAGDHERLLDNVVVPGGFIEVAEKLLSQMRAAADDAQARRREHIQAVRRRIESAERAEQERTLAAEVRKRCADAFDAAEQLQREASTAHALAARTLLADWQAHLKALRVLRADPLEPALAQLDAWIETAAGQNPMRAALERARFAHEGQLAVLKAERTGERARLILDQSVLQNERTRLIAGEDQPPPLAYTRAAQSRVDRAGAPFWHLVDFAANLAEEAKAGIEAALEAAGLLDAWITPEGAVLDSATHDVRLTVRRRQGESLARWLRPSIPITSACAAVSIESVDDILHSIACTTQETVDAETWISPTGEFRVGAARGAWSKPVAAYIGYAARESARLRRLDDIEFRLHELAVAIAEIDTTLARIAADLETLREECDRAPSDDALLRAQAQLSVAERARRDAHAQLAQADSRLADAEHARRNAQEALEQDARDLKLPVERAALDECATWLHEYRIATGAFIDSIRTHRRACAEVEEQQRREETAREGVEVGVAELSERRTALVESEETYRTLEATVGKQVEELLADIASTENQRTQDEKAQREARAQIVVASTARAKAEEQRNHCRERLQERNDLRRQAIEGLERFAATGLMTMATPELMLPEHAGWGVEAALTTARRTEQLLSNVDSEERDWARVQSDVSNHYSELQRAMSTQGHSAEFEQTDHGLIVRIVYQQRAERPDTLSQRLDAELAERRAILSAREREVLENHLQQEVAANLQRLIRATEQRVGDMNRELHKRPTSTGVRYRLDWQPLPEDAEGAAMGLAEARKRLLRTATDAWSPEDRRVVGEFLRSRIDAERTRDDRGSLLDTLLRALDYRRWHRFRVQRYQDGAWRALSGPASSGERALGLTVPLFAAASSHYESAAKWAPRLVLLDEAFAGIDDEARASCMALIREFDLDFLMTSEREWGCYPELPGLAICQLVRREGMDAVHVTRWAWDGRVRREEPDPERRFPAMVESND